MQVCNTKFRVLAEKNRDLELWDENKQLDVLEHWLCINP